MWLDKFFFIKSGFFFSASASRHECFIGIQHIDPPCGQQVEGFLSQGRTGFAQLLESFRTYAGDDFPVAPARWAGLGMEERRADVEVNHEG